MTEKLLKLIFHVNILHKYFRYTNLDNKENDYM